MAFPLGDRRKRMPTSVMRIPSERLRGLGWLAFDDSASPLMDPAGNTLGAGLTKLGSGDDAGLFDNLRVWRAPAEARPAPGFSGPAPR